MIPRKANCDRDIVFVGGYLFASCHIDNIDDTFGTIRINETTLYNGHYGILKINPKTHKVEHIFSKEDGLLNGYNYELSLDGDDIWVETFNGVGKINTRTNAVEFFQKELGIEARYLDISGILIDTDYVWVSVSESSNSPGGVAQYNKKTQKWKSFAWGQEPNHTAPVFPSKKKSFQIIDQSGLTQLQLTGSNKIYQLDGRINLDLSPMIGNKRYILTNATIDVIDDNAPFSQILIKLGERIDYPKPGFARLFVDPNTLFTFVLGSYCNGDNCGARRLDWLIDLNSEKIIKTYTGSYNFQFADGNPSDLIMVRENDTLIVKFKNDAEYHKGETIFTINTKNYSLTLPASPTQQ